MVLPNTINPNPIPTNAPATNPIPLNSNEELFKIIPMIAMIPPKILGLFILII